jgi:hypothetical protein
MLLVNNDKHLLARTPMSVNDEHEQPHRQWTAG